MDLLLDILLMLFLVLFIVLMFCGIWFVTGFLYDDIKKSEPIQIPPNVSRLLKQFFPFLKKGIKSFCKFFYTEATGHTWPGEEINYSIPLTIEELTQLIRHFEKKLYLAPTLSGYGTNSNVFFQIRIHSVAFKQDYSALLPEQQRKLAVHIIQSFYLEYRGFNTDVYILAISPTFLDIALPMSSKGRNYLEQLKQQVHEALPKAQPEHLPDLSEEIPLFSDKDEDNDSRL